MKTNVKRYVLLNVLLLLFSLSSVCSKLAAREEFMSFRFIMMYGFIVLLLGIYAIFWQQIITFFCCSGKDGSGAEKIRSTISRDSSTDPFFTDSVNSPHSP